MASPTSLFQDVITCDLCDNPTQKFCNDCQENLCLDCVSKHVEKYSSLTHNIVSYKNKEIQMVFPECEVHPNQRCEAYCQSCDVPVCIKCFLSNHKGHDAVELSNVVANKKEIIKKETKKLETVIIPKFQESEVNIRSKASKCSAKFDEIERETTKQRQFWHNEVDDFFDKLDPLIKSKKVEYMTILETHQRELTSLIPKMKKAVEKNKQILKTNRVSEVTDYKSKTEYLNICTDCPVDIRIPFLKTNTVMGKELSVELGEYRATLTQVLHSGLTDEFYFSLRELLDKPRVITTTYTGIKPLWRVVCVGADEAWISGEDPNIRRVDIHGSIKDSIETTCTEFPDDIVVTRQGYLMYGDAKNRSLNIVRDGKAEVMATISKDWTPRGLCRTRSGGILINLHNGKQNKIVHYLENKVKEEIFKDNNGKDIFKNGDDMLLLTENNNGDICVSDLYANTVIVLDNARIIRFQYDGTPAKKEKPFVPTKTVTDSMSHIIIADYNNNCLHILDENGQFQRCVDNCGLDKPCGLSIDSKGRLWAGMAYSGEVKVIQYME
ncbi:uncharacterized protein LOC134278455 [Saccostrea cucullata]|uniref:uncharacterized protein LOC134278455 n=1 Tax=Saccostrea cuccullata TaxID=36930 RepID=UPI002ED16382